MVFPIRFFYDFTKFFSWFPKDLQLFQFVEHWISSELHKTEKYTIILKVESVVTVWRCDDVYGISVMASPNCSYSRS